MSGIKAIYREFGDEINELRAQVMKMVGNSPIFAENPHATLVVLAEIIGGAVYLGSKDEDGSLDATNVTTSLDITRDVIVNTILSMNQNKEVH